MYGCVYGGGVGDEHRPFCLCLQLVDLSLRQSEADTICQEEEHNLTNAKIDTNLGRGSVQVR